VPVSPSLLGFLINTYLVMKRTKKPFKEFKLPDAINCSLTKDFTQVPNKLLRNPNITSKAKAILCLLLSNKEGWCSHIITIQTMLKEKNDAIRAGLKELEKHGYFLRVKYRDKKTKIWRGSFWAYTDIPRQFNIQETLESLANKGLEPQPGFPDMDYPDMDEPDMEKPALIIHNIKKTNNKNTNNHITASQFEKFWKMYPRKVDKGKALTKWNNICSRKSTDRPTWKDIRSAIHNQKESERWQDPKFIPHPTTWLNQSRWLDDPEEMKNYNRKETTNTSGSRSGSSEPPTYIDYDEQL